MLTLPNNRTLTHQGSERANSIRRTNESHQKFLLYYHDKLMTFNMLIIKSREKDTMKIQYSSNRMHHDRQEEYHFFDHYDSLQ